MKYRSWKFLKHFYPQLEHFQVCSILLFTSLRTHLNLITGTFSRKGVVKVRADIEDSDVEGTEEVEEGKVNIVQIVEKGGGVRTEITENAIQQL